MKVGILSLNINTEDLNYGAMLHSWAFLKYLQKKNSGIEAEIIDYTTPHLEKFQRNHPVLSYIKMRKWKSAVKLVFSARAYKRRLTKFKSFENKHMKVSPMSYTKETLANQTLKYDCLVCESDVIWSPRFYNGVFDNTFFLALDNMKDKRKIIYAASTANADFRNNELDVFEKLVQYPDYISCREKYGTDIIKKSGRDDAVTVVDPVLLLDKADYKEITAERLIHEPYLLIYIPLDYNKKYQNLAMKYAKKHNLKIVEISYYTWNSYSHRVMADAGIEDFLSLIKNAEVVFTNSFHAVCFSIIFHKTFYAFSRKTGRKTKDLCQRLGLIDNYMSVNDFHEPDKINYERVDAMLKEERERSEKWLELALKEHA